jgi:ABC-type cobalamin transport system permease subunit
LALLTGKKWVQKNIVSNEEKQVIWRLKLARLDAKLRRNPIRSGRNIIE